MFASKLASSMLGRPWQWLRAKRADSLLATAGTLRAQGQHAASREKLERAVQLDPTNSLTCCLLGRALAEDRLYDAAKRCFERAIALNPAHPDAYVDLGTVYRLQGDTALAESKYRQALGLARAAPIANYNLALVLLERGATAEALEHLRVAYTALPFRGDLLRLLVVTLIGCSQLEQAAQIAQAAAVAEPASHEAWLSLGLVQQKLHCPLDALASYEKAYDLNPENAELFNNRAIALQDLGRLSEAFENYDAALRMQPDFPLARFHRALAQLLTGNYAEGWRGYETRLLSKRVPARASVHGRWDGSSLKDRTVLVHGEQGLGDEIMFASCLPDLIAAARHCVIECSAKLRPLFRRSFPMATVHATSNSRGEESSATRIDCEVPLGSLPLYFRRSINDFPKHTGYLKADSHSVSAWKNRLDALGPELKVGISWRGGTHKTRSPVRSINLDAWRPILKVPGVTFVNLQYTSGSQSEIDGLLPDERAKICSWDEALSDYDETAALVCSLDLIISVCTAVVHLSGALGRPVWVLAPYSPEWRYGHTGSTMPWYPAARIFRQPNYGQWEPVIESVGACLREVSRASLLDR